MGFGALRSLFSSYGVFGHFDLAALRGCHTLNVCLFAYSWVNGRRTAWDALVELSDVCNWVLPGVLLIPLWHSQCASVHPVY
jgi:hypothetical protein